MVNLEFIESYTNLPSEATSLHDMLELYILRALRLVHAAPYQPYREMTPYRLSKGIVIRHVARMRLQRGMGLFMSSHHDPIPRNANFAFDGDTTTLPFASGTPSATLNNFDARIITHFAGLRPSPFGGFGFPPLPWLAHVAMFATYLPYFGRTIYTKLDIMSAWFDTYLLQSLTSLVILFSNRESQPCLPPATTARCAC
jgi:hypothetical protein